jgi:hypothetical protein
MSANLEVRALLLCLLLSWMLPATADVFTYIDANGNRVFTDQPKKGAKRVEIPPTNNLTGTAPAQKPSASTRAAKPKAMFHYQLLRILVPEPDTTIRNIEGNLIVSVTSEPALQDGHAYRLLLDGQPVGDTGRSPVFPLNNIDRGTHRLSVEIVDELGRVVERTPNQTFHMQRTSLAQKRQAHPCKEGDYGVRPECPLVLKPAE